MVVLKAGVTQDTRKTERDKQGESVTKYKSTPDINWLQRDTRNFVSIVLDDLYSTK